MGKNTDNRLLSASVESLLKQNRDLKHRLLGSNSSTDLTSTNTDVLSINVGGTMLYTTRETLTAVPGSHLALLWGGSYDTKILTDDNGNYFMDVDYPLFQQIIDYLQIVKLGGGSQAISSEDDTDDAAVTLYMEFFGLTNTSPITEEQEFIDYFTTTTNQQTDTDNNEDTYVKCDEDFVLTNEHTMAPTYNDNDVLNLYFNANIILSVKKSTLVNIFPNSLVAQQFQNDAWIQRHFISISNRNCILMELPHTIFLSIVNQLRWKAMTNSSTSIPVPYDDTEETNLPIVINHLFPNHTLSDFIQPIYTNNVEMDTMILQNETEECQLMEWLSEVSEKKPKLIYRASQDGWDVFNFHQKCDHQGPTVTIVLTTDGRIFGGYSDKAWSSSSNTSMSSHVSFLFALSPDTIYIPLSGKGNLWAVYHSESYGPTFGDGYQLHISSNANTNDDSYSNFLALEKTTYALPDGITDPYFLAGTRNFQIDNYEVFSV